MHKMRSITFRLLFAATASMFLALTPANADSIAANQEALAPQPWEKFGVSLGAFFSDTNSNVRVGAGLGVDMDVEKLLGLDSQSIVARAEALWRFSGNRRHRLDASWFAFRRAATRIVGRDFDIEKKDGTTVTVQAGSNVDTHFDLDIIEGAYSYSFLQDDRVDLAVVGGVYVMPIGFGIKATGLADVNESMNFTAPLPVVGLRMDVALTPRWFIRTGTQIFAIKYDNISGRFSQSRVALEFLPARHFGLGLGVDSLRFKFEGDSTDPDSDLSGSVNFEYTGAQLYGKVFF